MTTKLKREHLHLRALALRNKTVDLARSIEREFGRNHDMTIFARNAYCELQEVSNMLEGADSSKSEDR